MFKCDPQDIDNNTGHVVLTLRNGRFRFVKTGNHPISGPIQTGVYTGTRTRVSFIFNPNTVDEGVDALLWRFDGKYLHFKVLSALPDDAAHTHLCSARMGYEAHPWKKI